MVPAPPDSLLDKYCRLDLIHFTLPFDIWRAHRDKQTSSDLASWNYRKLRSNCYVDVRAPVYTAAEPCTCKCAPSRAHTAPPGVTTVSTASTPAVAGADGGGCGDDCINRMMFVECSPSTCPCADRCRNQRIQRHQWAPALVKLMTERKGWGVFTREPVTAGDFILEYLGEIVSEKEFKRRMRTRYASDRHHYCLNLDRGLVIDAHRVGSIGRFVNHSCNPNCEIQKWYVNGAYRMVLFAICDIEGGTELTYDYNFSLFNRAEGQTCYCDSSLCRGVIGGRRRSSVTPHEPGAGYAANFGAHDRSPISAGAAAGFSAAEVRRIRRYNVLLLRNYYRMRAKRIFSGRGKCRDVASAREATGTTLEALDGTPSLEPGRLLADILHQTFSRVSHTLNAYLNEGVYGDVARATSPYFRFAQPLPLHELLGGARDLCEDCDQWDFEIQRLFNWGLRDPSIGRQMRVELRDLKSHYNQCKLDLLHKFGGKHTALSTVPNFLRNCFKLAKKGLDCELDWFRCVCGLYSDSDCHSDLIQCSGCLVWQHKQCVMPDMQLSQTLIVPSDRQVSLTSCIHAQTDCKQQQHTSEEQEGTLQLTNQVAVGPDVNGTTHRQLGCIEESAHSQCLVDLSDQHSYYCELCCNRELSKEVWTSDEKSDADDRFYYRSFCVDGLHVREGDCVYLLSAILVSDGISASGFRANFHSPADFERLMIFRAEKLWKDSKGARFLYGYHYCRPSETYHEPTRHFYPQEVLRSPLYEVVPLDLVVSVCWVLEWGAYTRGRPLGSVEQHVYVCLLKVDKQARNFSRISKCRHAYCMKPFAFERFFTPLRITKTFQAHADRSLELLTARSRQRKREPPSRDTSSAAADSEAASINQSAKQTMEKYQKRCNNLANVLNTKFHRLVGNLRGQRRKPSHVPPILYKVI